jgi:hypothetical protein
VKTGAGKTAVTVPGEVTWEALKRELMNMDKETLAELVNTWVKNYWTNQSYWMVFTEERFGFQAAAELDQKVFSRTAQAQAHRIKKIFELGDDIQALAATLKFTAPQWVGAGFEWEFTDISDTRLAMVIHRCPMGTYRKANNLELLPCKEGSPPLYINLARVINENFQVRCMHAHPDPPKEGVMCEWEFVLEK